MADGMSAKELEAQVRERIQARFPNLQLQADTDIFEAGFVNSLFLLEMVQLAEKIAGRRVPREDLKMENFRTIASLVLLIQRLTAGRSV